MSLKLCNCNRTMRLDGLALGVETVHTELCRTEIGAFKAALSDDRCTVACTQEAPLFTEVAAEAKGRASLRFVNIRETAGWSAEGDRAMPKIAALLAAADAPEPEPVPAVEYRSNGEVLVIGPAAAAIPWAERLAANLQPAVLITDAQGGELPLERAFPVWSGVVRSVSGYLGAFEVAWDQSNPIDLEICTRCNACIQACPEGAIDFTYQVDAAKCTSHRACVKACGTIGAIDFERADITRHERFDLVLDLSAEPLVRTARKPQGYLAPGRDPLEQALAAAKLGELVGEFEKPRFFEYHERLCAHARAGKVGCTNCLDVCSTGAISAAGDKVKVEAHLCAGCGGCATVCPSGAMTHAAPRVSDLGTRLKRALAAYHGAGGKDAAILFHNGSSTRALIHRAGRRGKGLPARIIPMEVHHPAAVGTDVMLGALAYGASQVIIAMSAEELAEYGAATLTQIGYAEAIAEGLGYGGHHFHRVAEDLERVLWALAPARTVARPATFNLSVEKRTSLDFAIEHLARHAGTVPSSIPLGRGAPYGGIEVDRTSCTMCKACIGACPAGALIDAEDAPKLRFIERNCVQCGVCVATCPERSISLVPRLALAPEAKQPVVLNEAEPFDCVRCGKPFGTKAMIDNMIARLAGHSMFAGGPALRRLSMCADCRIIDMMETKGDPSITKLEP